MSYRVRWIGSLRVPVHPRTAWDLFSRVEDWSRWDWLGSADARWVGEPGWQPGGIVRVGHRPFTFDCEIVRVDAPHSVTWSGGGAGVSGEHTFRFLPDPAGCLVRSDEVFQGLLVPFMRPLVRWYWHRHLRAFRGWCLTHG